MVSIGLATIRAGRTSFILVTLRPSYRFPMRYYGEERPGKVLLQTDGFVFVRGKGFSFVFYGSISCPFITTSINQMS